MNFVFKKQSHTDKVNVWHDQIYIGEIFTLLKENKDIDWSKFRVDKTLKMTPQERFIVLYVPSVRIGSNIPKALGNFPSQEEAAQAILNYHRSCCDDDC